MRSADLGVVAGIVSGAAQVGAQYAQGAHSLSQGIGYSQAGYSQGYPQGYVVPQGGYADTYSYGLGGYKQGDVKYAD